MMFTGGAACSGDWSGAVSFGLAVAVGLTPQMLPMIVQANLARSVRLMRQRDAAVKRMDAVQNLGAMCVALPVCLLRNARIYSCSETSLLLRKIFSAY